MKIFTFRMLKNGEFYINLLDTSLMKLTESEIHNLISNACKKSKIKSLLELIILIQHQRI